MRVNIIVQRIVCDSNDCVLEISSQFTIIRTLQLNLTYSYGVCIIMPIASDFRFTCQLKHSTYVYVSSDIHLCTLNACYVWYAYTHTHLVLIGHSSLSSCIKGS